MAVETPPPAGKGTAGAAAGAGAPPRRRDEVAGDWSGGSDDGSGAAGLGGRRLGLKHARQPAAAGGRSGAAAARASRLDQIEERSFKSDENLDAVSHDGMERGRRGCRWREPHTF